MTQLELFVRVNEAYVIELSGTVSFPSLRLRRDSEQGNNNTIKTLSLKHNLA